jgi:hypothetical protein
VSSDARRFQGYASPHEPISIELMEEIATTHYRRALRTFVSRHGALLNERGSGVVGVLERWLDTPTRFETIWHVAFGKMREVIAEQFGPASTADIVTSAARLALRLCEHGMRGRWSLALEKPSRFRWAQWTLPACDRLEVVTDAEDAKLTLFLGSDQQVVRMRRLGDSATGWAMVSGGTPFMQFDSGTRPLSIFMPDTPEGLENMEWELTSDDETRALVVSGYQAAFAVLKQYAPIYVPFVNRLLRNLVPVRPQPGGYVGGGSLRDNPGTVKLPFEREVVGLAANLGHECAHQHYFLLRGAGRVDNGTDLALYTCAFVDGARDLPSLVLTYHAFANESIVLRTCERAGIPDPYAGERAELVRLNLEPIEEILEKSTALTPLGDALWRPAAEQLRRAFG